MRRSRATRDDVVGRVVCRIATTVAVSLDTKRVDTGRSEPRALRASVAFRLQLGEQRVDTTGSHQDRNLVVNSFFESDPTVFLVGRGYRAPSFMTVRMFGRSMGQLRRFR
jgi:hypothetical protein